ncbi:MAG: hypothetical protein BZY88_14160 [SAR202 cluster bacterium Io17-Chloro-G9]|nr:MAG: hypothetical protein BZY88_14160 [SAR202 cluster bacterium Io17-Chloro-G9]
MLQQIKLPRLNEKVAGFGQDPGGDSKDAQKIRSDVQRLVAARYFIVLMGMGLVAWLGIQAYFMGAEVTFMDAVRVFTVALIGPGLAWAASDKELRLLRVVDRRNSEIEQRERENLALNRMTQDHLAECFGATHPAHTSMAMLSQHAGSDLDHKFGPKLRPDVDKFVVLDPDDSDVDHRYFEAANDGHREISVN